MKHQNHKCKRCNNMEQFKIIKSNNNVILVDMITCQKKILCEAEYKDKTDEQIIQQYRVFCVKSDNRKA